MSTFLALVSYELASQYCFNTMNSLKTILQKNSTITVCTIISICHLALFQIQQLPFSIHRI